ncbi:MAG: Ni/Fe hydrogenase [Betaproteobacteria bacterium]
MTSLVILAWGNPSRGDDALGPEFLRRAGPLVAATPLDIALVTDFQLQPEHAADLVGRDLALFVDASLVAPAPFSFDTVFPARDRTFTSHALSPAALLAVCADAFPPPAPGGFTLAIRGERFELGEPIGVAAASSLDHALAFLRWLLATPDAAAWRLATRQDVFAQTPLMA